MFPRRRIEVEAKWLRLSPDSQLSLAPYILGDYKAFCLLGLRGPRYLDVSNNVYSVLRDALDYNDEKIPVFNTTFTDSNGEEVKFSQPHINAYLLSLKIGRRPGLGVKYDCILFSTHAKSNPDTFLDILGEITARTNLISAEHRIPPIPTPREAWFSLNKL